MCKSNAEGGERCNTHTSERRVNLESNLQSKVYKSMADEDRERVDEVVKRYDEYVEITNLVGSDSGLFPINEEDNDAVMDKIYANHAWNVANIKSMDVSDERVDYDRTVEAMGNPDHNTKAKYLRHTNPDFQKLEAETDRIEEKAYGRYQTEAEKKKLDKLSAERGKMISAVKPLSNKEIKEHMANNPYAESDEKASAKHQEMTKTLIDHYRKEQVYNRSEAYRKAYNEYAKTPAGRKVIDKIAENEIHENISKKAMEGLERRIRAHEHRGDEIQAKSARNELTRRKHVASAIQFTNKYAHLKKQMMGSQDVKGNISFDYAGKSLMVQNEAQFERTMTRADEAYGSMFSEQSPEQRRRSVEKELFKRKGVTSVKGLMNNPSIQSSFEDMAEKQESLKNTAIQFKADKIARKHAGEEDEQIANLRRKLF